MRRALTWLMMLPFAAASVLTGHAIAYRAAGVGAGDLHGYLVHAPQLVLILATLAVLGLALDARARRSSPAPAASLAIVAFVAQEHLERLLHSGELPFLLTSPVLWLGIALQLPLAVAVWALARRIAEQIGAPGRRGAPRVPRLALVLAPPAGPPAASVSVLAPLGRGPPVSF